MDAPNNGMRPIHPGEVLREEFLLPMGLTAHALAMALHVPAPRINDIARERRGVTADTSMRLGRYFGTSAEFYMGLQADYVFEPGTWQQQLEHYGGQRIHAERNFGADPPKI